MELKTDSQLNSKNVINFLRLVGKLKSLPRTGWVLKGVKDAESVASHMYRMSIMALIVPTSYAIDTVKCLKLSVVHDLAECIVGDITPFCDVSVEEKHRQEEEAIKSLTLPLGDEGTEIINLYQEYASQETAEAKFVKDLDRLDMILQAWEYEQSENKEGSLEEFFQSTEGKFNHEWTKELVAEIYRTR